MRKKSSFIKPRFRSGAESSLLSVISALSSSHDEHALPKQAASGQGPLLQNLLFTISRHRASIDYFLDCYSEGRIRPRLRRVLWWALAELFYFDGLPSAVIVDTATGYVKKRYSAAEGGFVNALLRRMGSLIDEEKRLAALVAAPPNVRLELPDELYQRWRKFWSEETIAAWAGVWQRPADMILRRCRNAQGEIPEILEKMAEFPWAAGHDLYRVVGDEKINLSELFSSAGEFYVQDPSTLLAPSLLSVKPGELVGDLCSAPGGKSLLLAEALAGTGKLYCRDRSASRLTLVQENLSSYPTVDIAVADALQPDLPAGSLQALLLDVPCSNTGVIRRRPDVRWTYSENKLHELVALQAAILDSGQSLLASGGRLVYSTCSIEAEENAGQTASFLKRHPEFHLLNETQLLPNEKHDGAYAALLIKK